MQLKSKSEINIDSAKLLEEKALFPSVIHCCYYGCFQLMKHMLCHKFTLDYEFIDSEVKSSKLTSHPISEHRYVWNKFESQIKKAKDKRDFSNLVKDLYSFRVKSDYKPIEIGYTESTKARNKADEIITIIKNNTQ